MLTSCLMYSSSMNPKTFKSITLPCVLAPSNERKFAQLYRTYHFASINRTIKCFLRLCLQMIDDTCGSNGGIVCVFLVYRISSFWYSYSGLAVDFEFRQCIAHWASYYTRYLETHIFGNAFPASFPAILLFFFCFDDNAIRYPVCVLGMPKDTLKLTFLWAKGIVLFSELIFGLVFGLFLLKLELLLKCRGLIRWASSGKVKWNKMKRIETSKYCIGEE